MPHKDERARAEYQRSYYKRRTESDPTYRQQLNQSRNCHSLTCQQCQTVFKGRKGKRFCGVSCATKWQWANHPNKPGKNPKPDERKKTMNLKGYVLAYQPEHPNTDKNGYVLEHRLVMESILGRPLEAWEQVHHMNSNRADNRPENLQLVTHATHRGTVICPHCQKPFQLH